MAVVAWCLHIQKSYIPQNFGYLLVETPNNTNRKQGNYQGNRPPLAPNEYAHCHSTNGHRAYDCPNREASGGNSGERGGCRGREWGNSGGAEATIDCREMHLLYLSVNRDWLRSRQSRRKSPARRECSARGKYYGNNRRSRKGNKPDGRE